MRTQTYTYENQKLSPLYPATDYPALEVSRALAPSTALARGALLGLITSAVAAVQTVTVDATGGTFALRFQNARSAFVAEDVSAANLQIALRAVPTIGDTGVSVTGSAGGPFTVTWALSGPIPLLECLAEDDLTTGGTGVSIAAATVGVLAGSVKAWNADKLTDPTTGPSVSATTGGTNAVGTYLAQMAWITALGETLPSLPVAVIVPDATSDRIRFAAISAGNTPDLATGIRYYLNGIMVAEVAVGSGAIAQTDVDAMPTTGVVPKGPQTVNDAYTATDGSHLIAGVLPYTVASDADGNITLGDTADTGHYGHSVQEIGIYATGSFRKGDLVGYAAALLDQGARIIGSTSDDEAIILL